jgi:hypothetical protein
MNEYYTYAYLREDGTPYYIGKGKGRRAWSRSRVIKKPRDKSRILILKKNLSESEAFKHEVYMIAVYGRKDLGTGLLHNTTNGGDGAAGRECRKETRKKHSENNKGKRKPPETRAKMSLAKSGENNPMYGKKREFSEEARRRMKESQQRRRSRERASSLETDTEVRSSDQK